MVEGEFEYWLAPENFVDGRQKESLSDLTRDIRVCDDPYLSAAN